MLLVTLVHHSEELLLMEVVHVKVHVVVLLLLLVHVLHHLLLFHHLWHVFFLLLLLHLLSHHFYLLLLHEWLLHLELLRCLHLHLFLFIRVSFVILFLVVNNHFVDVFLKVSEIFDIQLGDIELPWTGIIWTLSKELFPSKQGHMLLLVLAQLSLYQVQALLSVPQILLTGKHYSFTFLFNESLMFFMVYGRRLFMDTKLCDQFLGVPCQFGHHVLEWLCLVSIGLQSLHGYFI